MTRPDPCADQNDILDLVAPLQDLTLTPDTQEPARFRLQAEVPFPGPGPRPVVVIHFSAEATALAQDQREALTAEAREIRAGFALILSAGMPHAPETGGIKVGPPEPADPRALMIDFEVLNPTGDPFVAQLLKVATLLALIFGFVGPGRQRQHNMHKSNVSMHLTFGGGATLTGSDGIAKFVVPGCPTTVPGPVVTVRGHPTRPTWYYLY
jgi:hypothetical protein